MHRASSYNMYISAYIVYHSFHLFSTFLVISGIACVFFSNLFGNVYFVIIKFYVKTY